MVVSGDGKALPLIGIAPIGGKGDTQSRADVSGDLPFGPIRPALRLRQQLL